ncbi:MAG: RibD family protein [Phormidesmis sp.]
MQNRPYVTVVLAMSADGKITDAGGSAARFPSAADKAHLEAQVAKADATLFGAGTLRAYGSTLSVTNAALIARRRSHHQLDQPVQIVCSATGRLDPHCRFFQQAVPRWLITGQKGRQAWEAIAHPSKAANQALFEHILITEPPFNWHTVMQNLCTGKASRLPIQKLLVMGGGELVASLLAGKLIDELYLTICPLLIGGKSAPTPVGGLGFTLPQTPQLSLQSSRTEGDEVFLHYKVDV